MSRSSRIVLVKRSAVNRSRHSSHPLHEPPCASPVETNHLRPDTKAEKWNTIGSWEKPRHVLAQLETQLLTDEGINRGMRCPSDCLFFSKDAQVIHIPHVAAHPKLILDEMVQPAQVEISKVLTRQIPDRKTAAWSRARRSGINEDAYQPPNPPILHSTLKMAQENMVFDRLEETENIPPQDRSRSKRAWASGSRPSRHCCDVGGRLASSRSSR